MMKKNWHRIPLLKLLPQHRVDPGATVDKLLEILEACYSRNDDERENHLRLAKASALACVHHADVINRLPIWESIELPSRSMEGVTLLDKATRSAFIRELRVTLKDNAADFTDVFESIEVIEQLFRSMNIQFKRGSLSVDDWLLDGTRSDLEYQRYRCAALLPAFVSAFDRFWRPQIKKLEGRRKIRSSSRK